MADSLGWRHETAALPLLKPLLRGTNEVVACAAATALGRIGSKDATAALVSARNKATAAVQPAVLNGILQSAEMRLAAGDARGAASLYSKLYTTRYPDRFRIAAWRGVVLADAGARPKLVSRALVGKDHSVQLAALKVLREMGDPAVVKACLREWDALPATGQLAVLDAQIKVGGEVLPTVRLATQSPYVLVRAAGWLGLADLGDVSTLPALANAAAHGQAPEQAAAREALTRVRGPGIREALLNQIAQGDPEVQAKLLRTLGERDDTEAAGVLLEYAAVGKPARLAALDSLRDLVIPGTLIPLLDIAAASPSDAECEPALKALYAVCDSIKDKDQTTRAVLEAMARMPATTRRQVLPVLAELGTPAAMEAAQEATREQDAELAKQGVRVLAQWPNSSPAPILLELARNGASPTLRVLALRGCIDVAALEPDQTTRLRMLQQASAAATRPDEKKQAMAKIGQIPTPAALQVAVTNLADPDLASEAAYAAICIAEKLPKADAQLANQTAAQLLEQCKTPEVTKRAMAIRLKSAGPGPFIQDWLVCGPFAKPGVEDLSEIFKTPFGPENPGEKVQWKPTPHEDGVNLGQLFPGHEHCAAYLKTQVVVPNDNDAFLLLGSDDGVKAWLNGAVVHEHDVNRGDVPDSDIVPIHLKNGSNDLMLKITQGTAGWSAHARIVGADCRPIPGLQAGPG